MQADDELLNGYMSGFACRTKVFLAANGIGANEMTALDEGRMAYVRLMLIDYDRIQKSTRASIADCVLRGVGLGELVGGKVISRRSVMRMFIKNSFKECRPLCWLGTFCG